MALAPEFTPADLAEQPAAELLDALRTPLSRPAAEQLLDPAAGTVAIGQYADGTPAAVPLWTEHGAVPLGIVGDAGAGASVILRHLWEAEAASPLVRSWVAGFDQEPEHYLGTPFERHAGDPEAIYHLLDDAAQIAGRRAADMSNWPDTYRPTEAEPLVTLTLTMWELTRTDRDSVRLVERIAATGRRGGVSLRIVYRRHAVQTLGHALAQRLGSGALIALRGGEFGLGLGSGPVAVPKDMPGTGHLITPRRTGLFRSWAPRPAAG
ncbi:hypothetical protein ACFV1L_22030 [Kitasatospora sp. NPDC059646]|uniref:hypothetical protein n=1 Tax=Kitasatospora sp. NPDC059646 TaxID=3346893 RepID=UPI003682D1EB